MSTDRITEASADISPEAVERIAAYFDRLSSEALDAQFIVPMVRGAESEATAKTLRALRSALTASEKRVTELETENRHLRAEVYE